MCGIAGFVSKKFTEADLHSMTDRLSHRGPDADGFYFDPSFGVGLGHRRLSIIDLSSNANQPFYSANGRYVMIYNGEVYNYKEVQQKYSITPRTSSDTEIIIEAFSKAGINCLQDLNGMFAFAIWDKQEEALYLVRDRVGVKPLHYYYGEGSLAFASELKSLKLLPVPREINKDSVCDFLYLGYIPGDNTIYHSFYKLLPGHYAIFRKGNLAIHPYWQPEDKISKTTCQNEAIGKRELKKLVESSVAYSMVSDVPVGIFLSGGVDSSLVASAAQAISSQPVKTFSIGFRERKYNESRFADEVARYIGSDHHEYIVTEHDALERIEKMLEVYDQPYADSSAIPMMIVSELARKHVKVALSGDGGDELFMGYGFYYWARRLNNPFVKAIRKPLAQALFTFGDNRLKRGSYLFDYETDRRKSHIFSQEQYYFTEREIRQLVKFPAGLQIKEDLPLLARQLTVTEEQSLFDFKNYLPEELLVKADRASMYYSLEVRVPLLDHRLVEFALNVSPDLKLKGPIGKYLLKQVLYDYVPSWMFDRPKWGFSVPLSIWLKTELSYLLDRYLSEEVLENCGLVNPLYVAELTKNYLSGRDYLYNRIWALIILHKWYLEKHL